MKDKMSVLLAIVGVGRTYIFSRFRIVSPSSSVVRNAPESYRTDLSLYSSIREIVSKHVCNKKDKKNIYICNIPNHCVSKSVLPSASRSLNEYEIIHYIVAKFLSLLFSVQAFR